MKKVDIVSLKAMVAAKYRDYPNPTDDPVVAFEARAGELIGEMAAFVVQENNERLTPVSVMVQGFCGIFANVIEQIADNVPPDLSGLLKLQAVASFQHYLFDADGVVRGDSVPIATKDVGDA